jgi:Xaa-Pro aminopeptidase
MYTRVLMGNLDVESTKFPTPKTYGFQLDAIARRYLWEIGEDFGHSLGHGVSYCGPVHEYPHYAYTKSKETSLPFIEGMVVTNEPGFYKTNEYGIRIENILTVTPPINGFCAFENVTMVPYCKELIESSMLSQSHKQIV